MTRHTLLKDKKSSVLDSRKQSHSPLVVLLAIGLMLSIGAFFLYIKDRPAPFVANSLSRAETGGSTISYPVSLFADGKARHFEDTIDGLTVHYFILKSADGLIRAAFDACDVCWPAGKGYRQEGDKMVCRNCGRKFASVQVNEVQGGCNPAP